jgi:ABC-type bacteriocin/lantibiotic exporter with double-glycine peptidase domain
MMLIGAALETLSVGLIFPILSIIVNPTESSKLDSLSIFFDISIISGDTITVVIYGVIIFFSIYVFKNIFLSYLFWRQSKFIYNLMASTAEKLFKGYIYKPYIFHIQINSAELIRNLTTEMNLFNGSIKALTTLFTELLVLVGIASLLLFLQPMVSFVVGIFLLLATAVFYLLTKNRIKKWGEERQFHERYRIQHLQQSIGGNKEIKILENEREFINQFKKHNSEWGNIGQRQNFIEAIPRLWLEIVAIGLLSILIILLISTGNSLSEIIPIIGMFGAAAFRLLPSINRTIGALQRLIYTLPVVNIISNELRDILVDDNIIPHQEIKKRKTLNKKQFKTWRKVKIENICYKYPNSNEMILKNLNLTFNRGQSIGIIGRSGEGKSTFVDVLLKLLPAESGKIFLDNSEVDNDILSWRSEIGYVPQQIYLIDDSLKKNIALGLREEDIDQEKLINAIKLSQLDKFVSSLPNNIDTKVGERGVQISGGQSQRIGIARALYNDPSIILFDEATSSLDSSTENEVMRSIDSLKGDKSLILITHRTSTLKNCDTIYKLQHGSLIEVSYESV